MALSKNVCRGSMGLQGSNCGKVRIDRQARSRCRTGRSAVSHPSLPSTTQDSTLLPPGIGLLYPSLHCCRIAERAVAALFVCFQLTCARSAIRPIAHCGCLAEIMRSSQAHPSFPPIDTKGATSTRCYAGWPEFPKYGPGAVLPSRPNLSLSRDQSCRPFATFLILFILRRRQHRLCT
jgi:hypothetical protein